MLEYPSIPRSMGQDFQELPGAHVFDKLDGTSARSEWSKKRGWHKHGLRHTRLGTGHEVSFFAEIPSLFEHLLAEPIEIIARKQGLQRLVVFYEYWGARSLAGFHEEGDDKTLTLFDAAPEGEFMPPEDFRKTFEDRVPTARFLGRRNWTRGFIEEVRRGEVKGITLEGVVGKLQTRRDFLRAKAKTARWIDLVLARHGQDEGKRLVES